jgi:hemerythrin-like domain-containing protein
MEKAGISGSRELITSLKKEHEQERQLVNNIEDAVSKKEEYRRLPSVLDNSRAYIHLLIPHIDKEENDLFLLADVYLSQAVQNKLLEFFEVVETEIGPGKHEEYHNWLHTMGEIYINSE